MKKRILWIWVAVISVVLSAIALWHIQFNRATLTSEQVIERFYRSWLRENTTPGQAFERNVHIRSTYASPSLAQDVARGVLYKDGEFAFDPVVCGPLQQGEPGINMVYERDDRARAVLTGLTNGPVNVFAVKGENGWWYVDEIDCPPGARPEVPIDEVVETTDEAVSSASMQLDL